jgi:Xaa-Pro aminopeptidase
VRDSLAGDRVDALVVSDPHNLAWLLNLRKTYGAHPLALGYDRLSGGGPPICVCPQSSRTRSGRARGTVDPSRRPRRSRNTSTASRTRAKLRLWTRRPARRGAGPPHRGAGGGVLDRPDTESRRSGRQNAAEIAGTRAASSRRRGVTRFAWAVSREPRAPGSRERADAGPGGRPARDGPPARRLFRHRRLGPNSARAGHTERH